MLVSGCCVDMSVVGREGCGTDCVETAFPYVLRAEGLEVPSERVFLQGVRGKKVGCSYQLFTLLRCLRMYLPSCFVGCSAG